MVTCSCICWCCHHHHHDDDNFEIFTQPVVVNSENSSEFALAHLDGISFWDIRNPNSPFFIWERTYRQYQLQQLIWNSIGIFLTTCDVPYDGTYCFRDLRSIISSKSNSDTPEKN